MFAPKSLPAAATSVLESTRALPDFSQAAVITAEQRADWLFALQQISDAVAASMLQVLSSFDANGDGETLTCARSTASWLHGALRINASTASARVHLARQTRSTLATALDRVHDGRITYEHLQVIDKVVRPLPDEDVDRAVELLTDLASQVTVKQLLDAGQHLQQVVNPDGALASADKDFSRRNLYMSPVLDGMVSVQGLLDPESAATLGAALQPFLVPAGKTDDRDTAQRRADGLVALADAAMAHEQLPVSGGQRPQVNVITTLDTLTDVAGVGGRLEPNGSTLVPTTVQRMACDGSISRILLDPDLIPIQLGRSQRLFSPHQRTLLALRDGGCRFPECHLPPGFTDAHHIIPWECGGETDVGNALLLCRFHHRRVHEGKWRIEWDDPHRQANGSVTVFGPLGQRLQSKPRPADEHAALIAKWRGG